MDKGNYVRLQKRLLNSDGKICRVKCFLGAVYQEHPREPYIPESTRLGLFHPSRWRRASEEVGGGLRRFSCLVLARAQTVGHCLRS